MSGIPGRSIATRLIAIRNQKQRTSAIPSRVTSAGPELCHIDTSVGNFLGKYVWKPDEMIQKKIQKTFFKKSNEEKRYEVMIDKKGELIFCSQLFTSNSQTHHMAQSSRPPPVRHSVLTEARQARCQEG
jgi:hypothetical protein